ncbi:MAG TPA: threonine ammonia-lyase [Burkholderiales bacterium]|nr:threonine ammonia-lyase [Burkholderiales bacterium]
MDQIRQAADAISGHVINTPCLHSRTLSRVTGAHVFLKFENLQFTASFKERGAFNKLRGLDREQRRAGVIAASAGNHAQGVAYHAQRLGIPAVIVMPRHTPGIKIEHTRDYGAEVILHGELFDDAKAHALALAKQRGLTWIHAYDDEQIIAGQGTIALEMLHAQPALDVLVVPIGGGGLIAGIAVAALALKPGIEIIGVQTARFPSMHCAIKGESSAFGVSTIADGIAVKAPGTLTLPIIKEKVSEILLVDEGDIEQAIVMLLEIEKTLVEGAGAASLAAVLKHRDRFAGRRVGLVLSGGNIDPLMMTGIIERGMVRTGRLTRLVVQMRDLPSALSDVTACLAESNANVEQISHQRAFTSLPLQSVEVEFVLQTRSHDHVRQVVEALARKGYTATLHLD